MEKPLSRRAPKCHNFFHTTQTMSKKPVAEKGEAREEPFLLTLLPFAGLLLLLGAALLWRFLPPSPGADAAPSPAQSPANLAVERWERAEPRTIPIGPFDFTRGPEDAPVTIVEFSDFQCPYCRAGSTEVEKTFSQYGNKVRLVYKNFPLDVSCNETMTQQLHPFACRAAALARCAGKKDAKLFWRAHDLFFGVSELSDDVLARVPRELSLPAQELQTCMASEETLARVKEDIEQAERLGVNSTPTFFLNGRPVADYRDGALSRLVEHVLGSGSASASGDP
jgi:protein-disulfide isomerase